jgi:hypothetical protein
MQTCPEAEWNCGKHQQPEAGQPEAGREARQLILDALIEFGGRQLHGANCKAQAFQQLNRSCPPSHPVWKYAPQCDCIIGRMAAWLINQ